MTCVTGRCGYERDGSFSTPKGDRWEMFDAGIAAQTFCLAAHEMGLGTVIMGVFDENKVNEVIDADMPITMEYVNQNDVAQRFDLDRLPDGATQTVRIVYVGDYDECLCSGAHVEHTAQIGRFRISSTRFQDGTLRLVFRLDSAD
jgi:hypothetical protein